MNDKRERVIALLAGESSGGKSFFLANLKNALIYDADIGGGLAAYESRIHRNNSERIEVGSYVEILDDLKRRQRQTGFKNFLWVVIDHLSTLQQEAVLRHNPGLDRDFGSAAEKGTKEWRKIREFCRNQDFNLFCASHLKAKWESEKVVGIQAEASKNVEGDFHIVLHVRRGDKYPSNAWVQKWRRDPEDPRGVVPSVFPLTMADFERLAGPEVFASREPITLATPEQVDKLNNLLGVVKLPEGTVEKWRKKAGVDSFAEMPANSVSKCIDYVQSLIASTANGVPA